MQFYVHHFKITGGKTLKLLWKGCVCCGQVLRKVVHDEVDDGWWEGRIHGQIGLFPSLVVEECRENGEPLTPEVKYCKPPHCWLKAILVVNKLYYSFWISEPSKQYLLT